MGYIENLHLLISYCVTVLSKQANVLLINRERGKEELQPQINHRLTKSEQQTVRPVYYRYKPSSPAY